MNGWKKGQGKRQNASIVLAQRAKLFDWCKEHKEDKRKFSELAKGATKDLGFVVTLSSIRAHWAAVNGRRYNGDKGKNGGKLAAMIVALETRLAECERRLTAAGA
jgi:hypothetical protein